MRARGATRRLAVAMVPVLCWIVLPSAGKAEDSNIGPADQSVEFYQRCESFSTQSWVLPYSWMEGRCAHERSASGGVLRAVTDATSPVEGLMPGSLDAYTGVGASTHPITSTASNYRVVIQLNEATIWRRAGMPEASPISGSNAEARLFVALERVAGGSGYLLDLHVIPILDWSEGLVDRTGHQIVVDLEGHSADPFVVSIALVTEIRMRGPSLPAGVGTGDHGTYRVTAEAWVKSITALDA